ncbi:MAG: hypothetical protein M3Z14_07155 [Candidatus Eremiobacteraeota bacterium]|nr:hypothetical protein [Candidatus Eremiobacteraeota bacterium]
MNKLALATLAVAFILSPSVARADDTPTAEMQQIHQNMMRLHQEARSGVLAALTPAHRVLLGQVVGRLATDQNPDLAGAARTLNSALTPAESQSVLRIWNNLRTQSRQLMQAADAQMPGRPAAAHHPGSHANRGDADAGEALLRLAIPHAGPHMHM